MRIYITGPAWAGKSTLARALGDYYKIPVFHLDELLYDAGFIENDRYRTLRTEIIAQDEWIIEGASVSILKSMQDRVDKIITLNYSPIGNIVRIFSRFFEGLFWKKRIGWNGEKNSNKFSWKLLVKSLNWRARQLPRIRLNIKKCSLERKTIEMRSIKNVFENVVLELKDIP